MPLSFLLFAPKCELSHRTTREGRTQTIWQVQRTSTPYSFTLRVVQVIGPSRSDKQSEYNAVCRKSTTEVCRIHNNT